ncbi:hypothetical protein HDU76_012560 [Blyttiomyces sp. JEL0837]|nr:hypothetical protein HDU76_012560 [Blyttiomyces sp. JEL0837]
MSMITLDLLPTELLKIIVMKVVVRRKKKSFVILHQLNRRIRSVVQLIPTTTSSITYQFKKRLDFTSGSTYMTYPGVAKVGCSKLVSTKLAKKAPLVILSHGHPGKKELWSGHAEALASKGYAVVAIDHTDA